MPETSVIVPVYNTDKYLKQCVGSILMQTYMDFELILVDDGSEDRSGEICDNFASLDQRVKVTHKSHGGASSARNAGLKTASGKYVMFVDSDDYISEQMLQKMVTDIEETDCDLVAYNSYFVTAPSVCYQIRTSYKGVYGNEGMRLIRKVIDYKSSRDVFFASQWSKLFRKQVIDLHHIRNNEQVEIGEDKLFVIEYLLHTRTVVCSDVPYYYHVMNPNSTTKRMRGSHVLWGKYKIYLREMKNLLEKVALPALLPAALSKHLICMNSAIKNEARTARGSYFKTRRRIAELLEDREFRATLRLMKFSDLNLKKKALYVVQKYKMIELVMLKEPVRNLIKKVRGRRC